MKFVILFDRSDSSISVDTYDYSDVDDERDDKSPRRVLNEDELGPVTARFVIVRRGMDVVLECHDAVGNEDVTWEKQGGDVTSQCVHVCVFVRVGVCK